MRPSLAAQRPRTVIICGRPTRLTPNFSEKARATSSLCNSSISWRNFGPERVASTGSSPESAMSGKSARIAAASAGRIDVLDDGESEGIAHQRRLTKRVEIDQRHGAPSLHGNDAG